MDDHANFAGTELDDISSTGSPKLTEWGDDPLPKPYGLIVAGISSESPTKRPVVFLDLYVMAKMYRGTWDEEQDGPGFCKTSINYVQGGEQTTPLPGPSFGSAMPDGITGKSVFVGWTIASSAGHFGGQMYRFSVQDITNNSRVTDDDKDTEAGSGIGGGIASPKDSFTGAFVCGKRGTLYPGFRGQPFGFESVPYTYNDLGPVCSDYPALYAESLYKYFENFVGKGRSATFSKKTIAETFGGEAWQKDFKAIPILGVTLWTEFMTHDALMQQSNLSIAQAQLEGTLKNRISIGYPVKMTEHIADLLRIGGLDGLVGKDPWFSRYFMFTCGVPVYDFSLAIDTYMLDPVAFGATLIGTLTTAWSVAQHANRPWVGSYMYYPVQTDKTNFFGSLVSANSDFVFSSFKASYLYSSPIPPYFTIGGDVRGMNQICLPGDAMNGGNGGNAIDGKGSLVLDGSGSTLFAYNNTCPEEYICVDFCLFAKALYGYGGYEYNPDFNTYRPPGAPKILLNAMDVIFNVEDPGSGGITLKIYEDVECKIPDHIAGSGGGGNDPITDGNSCNSCHYFPPIYGTNLTIEAANEFMQDPGITSASGINAEGTSGTARSGLEKFLSGDYFLVGVTMQTGALDYLLHRLSMAYLGLEPLDENNPKSYSPCENGNAIVNLYGMVVTQQEKGGEFYHRQQGSAYMYVEHPKAVMSYPSVYYGPKGEENSAHLYNKSRWFYEKWSQYRDNPGFVKMEIFKFVYDVNFSFNDTGCNDIGSIMSVQKMHFGQQNSTTAIVLYIDKSDSSLQVMPLVLTKLEITCKQMSSIATFTSQKWCRPHLHYDGVNKMLTTYTTDGLIRIDLRRNLDSHYESSWQPYPWPEPVGHVSSLDTIVTQLTDSLGPDWSQGNAW